MKPTTPRRRRQQAQQQPQQPAAASFGGSTAATLVPFVIRASKTKHGPRSGGKLQYAQAAILALYPLALPQHVNHLQLWRDVNKQLARDSNYRATRFGQLSRMTVRRALQTLRDANR